MHLCSETHCLPSSSAISPSSSSMSESEVVRFSVSIRLSFNFMDSAAAIAAAALARFSEICSGVSRRPELSIKNVSGHLPRTFLCRFRKSGKMLRPSMCCGVGTPPMSKNVGAKSMFSTMSSTLLQGDNRKIKFHHPDPYQHNLHSGRFDTWTAYQKRDTHIEFEWKTFSFNQTELPQMISMIRCVYDERIFQFAQAFQFLQNSKTRSINNSNYTDNLPKSVFLPDTLSQRPHPRSVTFANVSSSANRWIVDGLASFEVSHVISIVCPDWVRDRRLVCWAKKICIRNYFAISFIAIFIRDFIVYL